MKGSDGTNGLTSSFERTREFKHLQMASYREHFLLSYLKILSFSPAAVLIRRPPAQ